MGTIRLVSRPLVLALMVAASPAAVSAQRAFQTTNRLIFGTPSDLTASIVFADVDGDGDADALMANGRHWTQVNEVYINNGAGQFTFRVSARTGESHDVRGTGRRSGWGRRRRCRRRK